MSNKKDLENSLSEVDVWKILLRRYVRLYPDGFYNLNGIFGQSVTFGFIKIHAEELQAITDKYGSIKEPWLTKLAYFMKSKRSKSDFPYCGNHVLVILGIMKLITEAKTSKE